MCVIICLNKNQEIPFDKFETACYNNEHGFGMVVRNNKTGKLTTIKKFKKDGLDPKELYDIINTHKAHDRYIHLRYNTVGETSPDNVHPFQVFKNKDNEVQFMHNGTIEQYKPKIREKNNVGGYTVKDDTGNPHSDSFMFATHYLTPALKELHNGKFAGYIGGNAFRAVIDSLWVTDRINRGILISEKEGVVILSKENWGTIKDTRGEDIHVSNNYYFYTVKRGTEYEKREVERKAKEAKQQVLPFRPPAGNSNSTVVNRKDITIKEDIGFNSAQLNDLLDTWQIFCEEDIRYLAAITEEEWTTIIEEDVTTTVSILLLLTSYINHLEECLDKAEEKKERAEKLIENLKKGNGNVIH